MHANSDALINLLVNHHKDQEQQVRVNISCLHKTKKGMHFCNIHPPLTKTRLHVQLQAIKQNIFNLFRNKTGERRKHALKC